MIDVLVILSGITDTFMDGTSPVRPFLLIACAILVGAATLLPDVRQGKRLRQLVAILVGVLFLGTFLLQLFAFSQAGIPQHALATSFANGEMTNTRLTHIHVGKAGLGVIVPPEAAAEFDAGGAMSLLVPQPIAVAISVLFVLAVLLTIYGLSRVVRETRERRALMLLLAALAGCVALTKSIDGGVLSDGALIAYVALVALLVAPFKQFTTYLSFGTITFVVAIAAAHLSGFYWGEGYAVMAAAKGGALLLTLLALHHATVHGASRKAIVLSVCAFIVVAAISAQTITERLAYLNRIVGEGNTLIRGNSGEIISGDLYKGTTVRNVIEQEGISYWYQPVMQRAGGCNQETVSYHASFMLAPKFVPNAEEVRTEHATLNFVKVGDRYRGELVANPCIPERIKEIQSLLQQAGLSEAVIYDLKDREQGTPDGDNTR